MSIDRTFESLEQRAVSALRNVDPVNGTIHDYRNILNPVNRATRALNNAYRALDEADMDLREIQSRQ